MTTRPPDLILRYRTLEGHDRHLNNLSNHVFSVTQIAHTKCFKSGAYIIVGLANEADRDAHASPTFTATLKRSGFELVESQERISTRTILARRLDSTF